VSKTGSQKRWLKEHQDDFYVKKSHQEGLRARSAYKLIELQEKDRLFKPGQIVVDLGSAPGGWSQVLPRWIGSQGKIIALDLLSMDPLPQVNFLQGDFASKEVLDQLTEILEGQTVDWVLSDMAPNFSGDKAVDQPRSMYLVELSFDFAMNYLSPGGGWLAKTFQGEGFPELLQLARKNFKRVVTRKPEASRDRSPECYVIGFEKK